MSGPGPAGGAAPPGLLAHLVVRRHRASGERFELDVAFDVQPGETVALLGPNGSGKSTALRAVAGLVPLSDGHVRVGAATWDEPAGRVFHHPEDRRVGLVFQDHLLFERMSVLENVAFGLRARRVPRAQARRRAVQWLERLGVAELAGARPSAVSGGQAQRIALARALVTDPEVLLLDEPLAALDATTRVEVRSALREHLGSWAGAAVLVTHDPVDAMLLADRVVLLEDGRAVQRGTPAQVARAPRTPWAAELLGLNVYRGLSDGRLVSLDDGGTLVAAGAPHGRVVLSVPPSAIALHAERPEGSPRNIWAARVTDLEPTGPAVRVRLDGPPAATALITPEAVRDLGLTPGSSVWASVKATEVRSEAE